ncbi:hypothetical protein Trydic_g7261 [Trypoxylus dichotomus]
MIRNDLQGQSHEFQKWCPSCLMAVETPQGGSSIDYTVGIRSSSHKFLIRDLQASIPVPFTKGFSILAIPAELSYSTV